MEKRVPKSEKYKNISGVLNTGLTAAKVKYVSVREYSRRRDEIFYRVTKDMLAALYDEFEGISHVRSASRVGFSDLGVNRRRVEKIRSLVE